MPDEETSVSERWWTVQHGAGPIVATAIHDGHELRAEVAQAMALSDADRLREEDPFTGQAVVDVPTHVIVHRSRFEFDLNRDAQGAIYRTPDQSWGLDLWREPLGDDLAERSLAIHAAYYLMLARLLDDVAGSHQRFVLLDTKRDGRLEPAELVPFSPRGSAPAAAEAMKIDD